jgi:antitoxin component HigA of HigAB toxin-antitoxin module
MQVEIVVTTEASMSHPRPVHPGEVLAEELKELGVSASDLARQIGVPANRISQILARKPPSQAIRRSDSATGSEPTPLSG